jgi:uncharacterized membrane protein YphA (DoxX/SURF4 family)
MTISLAASTAIAHPFATRAHANKGRRSVTTRASETEPITVSLGALGLRLAQGALMVHNGLDKLADPKGFAEFVVSRHLDFLPEALTPEQWTIGAAGVEIVAPMLLAIGVLPRLSALSLLGTMSMAVAFHVQATGLEGFPLSVVEAHQYAFETASLYAAMYLYLFLAGPGRFSAMK